MKAPTLDQSPPGREARSEETDPPEIGAGEPVPRVAPHRRGTPGEVAANRPDDHSNEDPEGSLVEDPQDSPSDRAEAALHHESDGEWKGRSEAMMADDPDEGMKGGTGPNRSEGPDAGLPEDLEEGFIDDPEDLFPGEPPYVPPLPSQTRAARLLRLAEADEGVEGSFAERGPLPNRVWVAVVVYLVSYLYLIMEGYYLANGLAMLVGYLILYPHLDRLPGYDWLQARSQRHQLWLLFGLALALRWGLLWQGQDLTLDLQFYVHRSQALVVEHQQPYLERADINKPPLFALYLWLVGSATEGVNSHLLQGTGLSLGYQVAFRGLSSVADALVVLAIYRLMKARFPLSADYGVPQDRPLNAALAYALFPIAVESSGLSGHYDPLVILCTLAALHLVWPRNTVNDELPDPGPARDPWSSRKVLIEVGEGPEDDLRAAADGGPGSPPGDGPRRAYPGWLPPLGAGLLLGLGIALKFYPLVMAPFLLFMVAGWRHRLVYLAGLPVATLVSFGVLEWRYPGATRVYLDYQGGDWMEVWLKSWARALRELSGTSEVLGVSWSNLFMLLFGLLGLVYLTGWVLARAFGGKQGSGGSPSSLHHQETGHPESDTENRRREGSASELVTDIPPDDSLAPVKTEPGQPSAPALLEARVRARWLRLTRHWPGLRTEQGWTLMCFQLMVAVFLFYYLFQIASGFFIFEQQLHTSPPGPLALLWIAAVGALLVWFLPRLLAAWTPEELDTRTQEPLVLMLAFAVMILLFASPDYPTWYLCWFAPFLLMAPTFESRYLLLLLMVWNTPGEGLSILPGLVTGEGVT